MFGFLEYLKRKQIIQIVLSSAIVVLSATAVVSAVTTISGSSISSGGAISASGDATFSTLSVTGSTVLDSSTLFLDAVNNYVGIGTTSPSAKVTVWGSGTGANMLANFVNSASTTLLAILENGNVGVGTTTPDAKMAINGTFSAATSTVTNINFGVDSGSTDDYAITLDPAPYSYTRGMQIAFIANTANTGVCTINVNGLGAKKLKTKTNQYPTDNYIAVGSAVFAVYDGTNFQVIQPAANTAALIAIAWHSDTPSGVFVPASDQTVAKITITNPTNVGSYAATIKSLNFAISQTGISNTANRELKIYKDSIIPGNLLVTTSWVAVGNQNFGDTAITDAGMTDVEITAGVTTTFFVTMSTSDASSDDALSISVAADDVDWSDGVASSIVSVDSLPLSVKTLTY